MIAATCRRYFEETSSIALGCYTQSLRSGEEAGSTFSSLKMSTICPENPGQASFKASASGYTSVSRNYSHSALCLAIPLVGNSFTLKEQ